MAAVVWSALSPTVAHAATWTWLDGTFKANTWRSTNVYSASYTRHTTTTLNDLASVAYQTIPGVGTASASGSVSTTFTKRTGTFKCKWNWVGQVGNGYLKCKLS